MKNLFDYATKELSQDAFLAWLFNNWDDPEIGCIAKKLIGKLTNTNVNPVEISDIEAILQYKHMDIVIDFKINGVPNLMIIEDKINSSTHDNQLIRYKNEVARWNAGDKADRQSFFIYYKTGKMDEYEICEVEEAGWQAFLFESIKDFWQSYRKNQNLVIAQYANHIAESWNDSQYKELPLGGDNEKLPQKRTIQRWAGFFENFLKQNIDVNCDMHIDTFYNYAALQVRPKGKTKEGVPYLEIKSRDCLEGKFVASVLLHDADKKYFERMKKIVENNPKGILFKYETKIRKQVASTRKRNIKFSTKEELLELTKKAIGEFLDLMAKTEEIGDQRFEI